ncbi:unnamed protein product [Acanthoscelides obtectus]|uniref:TRAF3-interacting protein 1 n=2 Tax=Acanthoscelides obtectus TaxID=200917 RepID=A0A9P0PX04_ACAOB|nr:unnamed protein product [Acanthoscelides obtectus]CAK1670944.1 TRAF3-interacting protein 1 [Acanthoscelides obtectus]
MEDIAPEVIKKTQKLLGKYVKKPPLTEKLLRKPPFRFLHDVIKAVIKETHFLKGLFTENELKSENVTDKDAKIAFLNKLIEAVKTVTKTDLPVRASKIVAGLEPINTNLLLQTIGKALDEKIDSSEYVSKLKSVKGSTNDRTSKTKVSTNLKSSSKTSVDKEKHVEVNRKSSDTSRSKKVSGTPRDLGKDKNKQKNKINDGKKEGGVATSKSEKVPAKIIDANLHEPEAVIDTTKQDLEETKFEENLEIKSSDASLESQTEREDGSDKKLEEKASHDSNEELKNNVVLPRPKSAKPKSGELHSKLRQNSKDEAQNGSGTTNLEPAVRTIDPTARPRSSLRPPSVRPSSARPGAPRLRPDSALPMKEPVAMGGVKVIVENVDTQDDDDTVVVENVDVKEEEEQQPNVEIPLDNKGHLVEQILEQIQEDEGKKKIEIDWEYDSHVKDAVSKELSHLRMLIQNVTKTTSPLGKLMNYLHEDIDSMYSELEMWTSTRKQLYSEIKKKKKLNDESMKPMYENLGHLSEDMKKLQQEILSVQSTIIRNDLRIKELLSK